MKLAYLLFPCIALLSTSLHADIDATDQSRMGSEAYDEYVEGVPLTVDRVIELTKKGIDGEKIIYMMKKTDSMYCDLTRHDVRKMKATGVDRKVIKYMKRTCRP